MVYQKTIEFVFYIVINILRLQLINNAWKQINNNTSSLSIARIFLWKQYELKIYGRKIHIINQTTIVLYLFYERSEESKNKTNYNL